MTAGGAALPSDAAAARAAAVARAGYGRLLGLLAARTGDIAAAEDALAEALERALVHWPARGIPDNPEAWLVRVARNRLTDGHRRALRDAGRPVEDADRPAPPVDGPELPDPRLGLLFVCAHPAIAPDARTPLMLQTILGFTAAEIARAYVRSPAALAKLLGRAKASIKANAIPFRVPEGPDLPQRLDDVCEAIYGAYAMVWTDGPEAADMQHEAVYLADLLATLFPADPEVLGHASLLAFLHARRRARIVDGAYVPLETQDPALWDSGMLAAATGLLRRAVALRRPGRFQTEAAIQSVHAARAETGATDWPALAELHAALLAQAPTLGARVSHAAVIARLSGPAAGLRMLDRMPADRIAGFQPYWATRAHLLAEAGQREAAQTAYARAISLTLDGPARRFLEAARARSAAS